jgi:hypothetical protein
MALGQAVGAAAVHAIDEKRSVQEVPYARLRSTLGAAGQIVSLNLAESKDGTRTDRPRGKSGH